MKKSQKRQKRLVLVAMVLMIGLVAGMGAMTYSKYISTTAVPTQNATAAKWGFTVTANADNLFGKNYTGTGLATIVNTDGLSVKASESANVVAPGTTGSMTITVSGQAEVAARLSITIDADPTDIAFDDYKPLKWTLTKKVGTAAATTVIENTDIVTLLDELDDENTALAPGATLDTIVYTLSWAWTFDVDAATNVKDTLIGYKAAGKTYAQIQNLIGADLKAYSANVTESEYNNTITTSISFGLKVTIEQTQVPAP